MIDEVDSMLLDKSDTVLYLSHHVEELKYLRRVFYEIWDILCQIPDVEIDRESEN